LNSDSGGSNNTIQKNEQISTESTPRTEPDGSPKVGYSWMGPVAEAVDMTVLREDIVARSI
jgi:hypothetical protein